MPSIDLRIRRLGVRVPPSAPAQRPVPTLGPAFRVLRTQRSTATLTATAVHPGASPPWSSSWSSQSLSRRSASLVTLSGDLGVDLHCERDPAVPEDGHRDARVNVERGRERAAGTTGVVERDGADAVADAPDVEGPVDVARLDRAAGASSEHERVPLAADIGVWPVGGAGLVRGQARNARGEPKLPALSPFGPGQGPRCSSYASRAARSVRGPRSN
jgi:hypothetical protein